MQAIERFNIAVTTATVAVMFFVIQYLLPMLQASTIPADLAKYIPFVSPSQFVDASKLVLTALATLSAYKLLASALIQSIDKIQFLKSFIFGPSYVEGTWIGRFKAGNESKWTVERFEQTLDRIVIQGCAENADGTTYATWKSTAVAVDFIGGMLTYAYDCDVIGRNAPQQGIGIFQLQRKGSAKPPYGLNGYSTDLTDGQRSPNNEIKISDGEVPRKEAMERARQEFP